MPAFRRLLDAGPCAMDQLCLRFGGFYQYAKILEAIAAGMQGQSEDRDRSLRQTGVALSRSSESGVK